MEKEKEVKGGKESCRLKEIGATCVKNVFLYELCGIGLVGWCAGRIPVPDEI